jgi:uncharacterized lipoprotein YddW (UPF0748 family)
MSEWPRLRRGIVCLFVVSFWCVLLIAAERPALSQAPIYPAIDRQELRGVWLTTVDSDVLFNRNRLDQALHQLADFQFNTVYPAVWNWGYTLYPSPTAERAIGYRVDPRAPDLQEWDALAAVVDQGHRKGLAVIPWFEFGFMTTAESNLVQIHPDWITERRDGTQIWQDGIYERRWLNPFKPEVQQFIQDMILEIVTRYEIDGIQFDDHLGLPVEFGYDEFTVKLYQQSHQGRLPPADPNNAEWVRWRADQISRFMAQVFHAIKARKRDIVVSLSPNNYPFAYTHYLQDWRKWEREGLIEELILQVYSNNLSNFTAALTRPEVRAAQQHIPVAIGILTGLKDLPVSIHHIEQQIRTVRDHRFAGMSFFFYETLWNLTHEEQPDRQTVFRRLLAEPVTRPDLLRRWSPSDRR